MLELDRTLYTVAWIAPLYIEAKAALLMLDQRHRGHFPVSRGDDHVYHAGSICGHNVVIATLPAGQEYGNGSAAARAGQLSMYFPNLWFGLLVGVAAGLPNLSRRPQRDIRLGDVLVALPDGDTAALVAYDLGKETGAEGFQPLRLGHVLAHTKTIVRSAIGKIRLAAPNDGEVFLSHYEKIKEEEHGDGDFMDPGQERDRLHDFDQCGEEYEVRRQPRPDSKRTRVWYGPIGSGEKLMRNGRQRNELRDKYNIIGLEMEAAGNMNRIPVGVIRGVCDYADEHKNKEWQPYAAAMAASYAKAVLQEILPDRQDSLSFVDGGTTNINARDNIQQSHFVSKYFESSLPEMRRKRQRSDDREYADSSIMDEHFGPRTKRFQESRESLSMSLQGNSPESPMQIEKQNECWPKFQTERPGLSPKYLQRDDTPSYLLNDSDAWKTHGRRTPWTVVIYGLSGVGKSQMCLKAVIEHEQRFQGVFYIDASNAATADRNFVGISRVCKIRRLWEGVELEEQIQITRSWLSRQKDPWILIIDNADSTEVQLQKYIPTVGPGTVLITTTDEQFALCGHNFCKIGSMEDNESFNLLMLYKRPEACVDSAEMEAAKTLAVHLLGGLPLAIAQAGSYIFNNRYSYTEYLEEFSRAPQVSLNANFQPEQWSSRHQSIWTTFALSLRRIKDLRIEGAAEAVELLKISCFLHHDSIHDRIFNNACGNAQRFPVLPASLFGPHPAYRWETRSVRAAFNILCRYSFLSPTSSTEGRYSMHGLLQTICRNLMSLEEQKRYALYAASLIAAPLADIETPLSWIENPSGFGLQASMLPHIKACFTDPVLSMFQYRPGASLGAEVGFKMLLLFAKANSATGHLQEAKLLVEKGLDVLDTYPSFQRPPWIKLRLLEQRATCEAHMGRHVEAFKLRQDILKAWQSTEKKHSDTCCVAMMNVSDSLWAIGRRKDALEMAEQCMHIRQELLPHAHPKLHRTKRKVAEFLHGLDQRRQALILRENVYHEARSRHHRTDMEKLDFLSSKTALSDSYQWDGQLLRALELRQEVYERRNDILGPEHPETLLAHDRLLVTKRYCTNDHQEQQKLCQLWKRSVVIWKHTVGELHPHTLEARVNLGLQLSSVRELTAAFNEQEYVLNIRRRQFEENGCLENLSTYLSSLANVASLLAKIKQNDHALDLRKTALEVANATSHANDAFRGKAHNSLLNCEADIFQRYPKEVLRERRNLLKSQKSSLPEDSPIVLRTMSHLATDYEKLGHRTRAVEIRRQLMMFQQTTLGPENQETVDNIKRLAFILARKSRRDAAFYSEAVSLLRKVEGIQSKLLGTDHFQALATRAKLHCVYSHAGSHRSPTNKYGDNGNTVTHHGIGFMEGKSTGKEKLKATTSASSDSPGVCSSSIIESASDSITGEDTSDFQSCASNHTAYYRGLPSHVACHRCRPRTNSSDSTFGNVASLLDRASSDLIPTYGVESAHDSSSNHDLMPMSSGRGYQNNVEDLMKLGRRLHYSMVRYRYNKSPPETSFGESGSEASEE